MQPSIDLTRWIVLVWAANESDFKSSQLDLIKKGCPLQIQWIDSKQMDRKQALEVYADRQVVFLDADCRLNWTQVSALFFDFQLQTEALKKSFVYCGQYKNPLSANRLQRAHNWIANRWLKLKFSNQQEVFLGGAFVVCRHQFKKGFVHFQWPQQLWGGEDALLSDVLIKSDYQLIYEPRLEIEHHTSKSWKHFIRRAFLHGYHQNLSLRSKSLKVGFILKTELWTAKEFWLLLPEIFLHFVLVKIGVLAHRAVPKNTQGSPRSLRLSPLLLKKPHTSQQL